MRIFLTGVTGYIGHAVARAFRRDGHQVSGLVRSEDKAKRLWADEIRPVLGDLKKTESFAAEVRDAEVVIHAAAEAGPDGANFDQQSVERMLGIQAESPRNRASFVYTSGVWICGDTGARAAVESDPVNPAPKVAWRPAVEELVLRASSERLSTVVLRPGCVYGGAGGLPADWFASAEKEGAARMVGEGNNHWAMIHLEDLAAGYRAAVHAGSRGEIFHLTDRSRATVRELARAASRAVGRNGEVKAWPVAEAAKVLGQHYAEVLTFDQHVDSWKAVRMLGWRPNFGGFADDAENFYRAWKNHE